MVASSWRRCRTVPLFLGSNPLLFSTSLLYHSGNLNLSFSVIYILKGYAHFYHGCKKVPFPVSISSGQSKSKAVKEKIGAQLALPSTDLVLKMQSEE